MRSKESETGPWSESTNLMRNTIERIPFRLKNKRPIGQPNQALVLPHRSCVSIGRDDGLIEKQENALSAITQKQLLSTAKSVVSTGNEKRN